MNVLCADTFFFLALLNKKDSFHEAALRYGSKSLPLLTTAWVLTEVGDALSDPENRDAFLRLLNTLQLASDARIIPPSESLFQRGVDLYRERSDKDWSLTDCISFVVMQDEGVTDALTGDHHFEQAGFCVLLK
jgi:predicted nucleic acid-binding protein